MTRSRHAQLSVIVVFAACGTPGTNPHDMSVAGHERTAREHELAGDEIVRKCAQRHSEPAIALVAPCWTSRSEQMVKAHRDAAAQHRAASAALRDAEASACAGIAAEDRDMSPFENPEDIVAVERLVESVPPTAKLAPLPREVGVVVTFRAVPGLTAEWLQRIVDCHLARNAALGHVVPEMPNCPLVPRGVSAHVRSVGNGFAVEVRAEDRDTVREIRARAERLIRRDRTASH